MIETKLHSSIISRKGRTMTVRLIYIHKNISSYQWLFIKIFNVHYQMLRRRGQWAVNYTSHQSFLIFLSFLNLNLFMNFDCLVHWVECPNVSTTNCNLQKVNFVYHQWGCISIYKPLSYPFGTLHVSPIIWITIDILNSKLQRKSNLQSFYFNLNLYHLKMNFIFQLFNKDTSV